MTAAWLAEDKTGPEGRPTVRATIQVAQRRSWAVDMEDELHRLDRLRSYLFGNVHKPVELPNIKSFNWSRSVDQDAAEATLVLSNAQIVPIGFPNPTGDPEDFEQQGYLSPTRGTTFDLNPWGYDERTAWSELLAPDRIVRTYEGYGCDPNSNPEDDPHLKQSGTWLIDDVEMDHLGNITVRMRDTARLLLDQIVFPGGNLIPLRYPVSWSRERPGTEDVTVPTGGSWRMPAGRTRSSNDLFVGKSIETSSGDPYVGPDGTVDGHKDSYPLNRDPDRYWRSTGMEDSGDYESGERAWWEITLNRPMDISAIRLTGRGSTYRVFISLWGTDTEDGNARWYGRRKIPYAVGTEGVDLGADIPTVKAQWIARNHPTEIPLRQVYRKVTKIRITFRTLRRLSGWNRDRLHPYSCALAAFEIYQGRASKMGFTTQTRNVTLGNYTEYSQIVRQVLAWTGFFWPEPETNSDYLRLSDGTRRFIHQTSTDAYLKRGNVWADIMSTGTAGVADLTADLFDKQPMHTIIRYIADMVGFIAFVDETGALVFRMPNIWTLGNYMSADDLEPRARSRTASYITISEEDSLIDYSTTTSSRNIRELIFVGNVTGKPSVVIPGYTPGQREPAGSSDWAGMINLGRAAGWSDQHFANVKECLTAASLVATKQKFAYRTGRLKIHGYPAIQVDDQIRVLERVTNETYFHYVRGISSTLDMEEGTWTYDLETHWLGETVDESWAVPVANLSQMPEWRWLYDYLEHAGVI